MSEIDRFWRRIIRFLNAPSTSQRLLRELLDREILASRSLKRIMMTKLVAALSWFLPKYFAFRQIDQMRDSSETEERSSRLHSKILWSKRRRQLPLPSKRKDLVKFLNLMLKYLPSLPRMPSPPRKNLKTLSSHSNVREKRQNRIQRRYQHR